MSDPRVGQNETLFRQANERIEELNEAFGSVSGLFDVVCECGDLACTEQIAITRDVYERVRSKPHQFIVKPGHEEATIERVVERQGAYVVVAKHPEVAPLAEETDPRR